MGSLVSVTKSPTNQNNAGVSSPLWTFPGSVFASDNTYASNTMAASNVTDGLVTWGYGFAIPTQVQILGVEVLVERSTTFGLFVNDFELKLMKTQPTPVGTNHASASMWPGSGADATVTYGNALDLWGLTLTPAEINSSNFGVFHRAQNTDGSNGAIIQVDQVQVRVSYYIRSNVSMVV